MFEKHLQCWYQCIYCLMFEKHVTMFVLMYFYYCLMFEKHLQYWCQCIFTIY
ncbi:hypothetical protein Mgra_00008502 [Meloidogyne graminicola]|uniref:Uncharacterized protein n=1 Tax=Meloidogyne graminicola TaxID=189291 RepID=A0A8S9ZFG6_9BILA|nr:hypothetical protein Mgra_00008502 [Meloidogyne graminicola]